MTGDDEIGLIDFDTAARGEAALDVANLLVHLELRVLQGLLDAKVAAASADAFIDGYAAVPSRMQVYADAARLRLACVYAYRPRWSAVPRRMVDLIGRGLPAGC